MVQHNRKQKTFLIYTPENVKDRTDLNVYAIYPDYWGEMIDLKLTYKDHSGRTISYKSKHSWGEIPCLGYVKETSEFWAEKAAYVAGFLPVNFTFGPRAIQIKTKLSDLKSEIVRHEVRRKPYRKYHPNTKK